MEGLLTPKGAQPEMAGQQQSSRKATPQEQQAYTLIVSQLVKYMATQEVTENLKELAERIGPEKALASVMSGGLQAIKVSAENAGVEIEMHTGVSALKEVVSIFVALMAGSGIVQDAELAKRQVLQLIMTGADAPGQETMEA